MTRRCSFTCLCLYLFVVSLSASLPFTGEDEDEVEAAVTSARWKFEPKAFASITAEAKKFVTALLDRKSRWVGIRLPRSPENVPFESRLSFSFDILICFLILLSFLSFFCPSNRLTAEASSQHEWMSVSIKLQILLATSNHMHLC